MVSQIFLKQLIQKCLTLRSLIGFVSLLKRSMIPKRIGYYGSLHVQGEKRCHNILLEGVRRALVLQIDMIFRYGSYRHPLVNELSCIPMIEDQFNELFSILPKEYQDKLLGEIISYQDGDKDYAYQLIDGSGLMGF